MSWRKCEFCDKGMNDPCAAFRDARSCPNFDSMQRSRYSEKQKPAREQGENERLSTTLSAAQKKIAELEAENLRVRAALANSKSPCVYCSLPADDFAKCRSGFPGCARADDMSGCPEFGAMLENYHLIEALTAERQRWESAETAAKPFAFGDPVLEQILFGELPDDALGTITVKRGDFRRLREHFTRYPTASDSEERGG